MTMHKPQVQRSAPLEAPKVAPSCTILVVERLSAVELCVIYVVEF